MWVTTLVACALSLGSSEFSDFKRLGRNCGSLMALSRAAEAAGLLSRPAANSRIRAALA
jgi:hypothetical protein